MARWTKDGVLRLGKLGQLYDMTSIDRRGRIQFQCELDVPLLSRPFRTEAAARRAAICWLRAALKQATRKLEG